MRTSALAIVLVCAACNADPVPPARAAPTLRATPVTPESPPIGVPHGGSIQRVAITEQADAAISLDSLGSLRLWPALDGTREPIAIEQPNARAIAIAPAGRDLLVAILDVSGSVRLLRYTREGRARGSAQVPGDAVIEDLVAIEGGVLVARGDRSIERYDAGGGLHGRIALEPGEELRALATRRGGAAALIGHPVVKPPAPPIELGDLVEKPHAPVRAVGNAEALRWIELADGLQWGSRVTVPADLQLDQLAISPSHHRFATVSQDTFVLHVFDGTTATATPVEGYEPTRVFGTAMASPGFLDDDHVARVASTIEWWVASTADPMTKDPWKVYAGSTTPVTNECSAIGDGLVVSGYGANLALQSMSETRFLGWRDPADGVVATNILASLTLDVGQRLLTLDRRLERTSEIAFADHGYAKPSHLWWLDANHAVTAQTPPYQGVERRRQDLTLVDLRSKDVRVALGSYTYIQRVEWDAELHTLAVVADGAIMRFHVDPAANTLAELPVIKVPSSFENVRLLDPKRADGANLVVIRVDGETGDRRAYWITDSPTTNYGLPTKEGTLLVGFVAGISPTGALYIRGDSGLVMTRKGQKKLYPHLVADWISADRSGERLLGLHQGQITLFDPAGTERWHQIVWGAQRAMFSPDGTQVVIQTPGGIVALDAATGARTAMVCGFSFGLMTNAPELRALDVEPVCEDLGT